MSALRTMLALLMAGVVLAATAGCGSDKTTTPQNQQLTKERQDKIGERKAKEEANQGGQ
jgi:hypothetical protein